jgi:ribonuclease HII
LLARNKIYFYGSVRWLKRRFEKNRVEAGCDEAGRGCLAGPVYAAAVIFPETFFHREINDSKLLSPEVRQRLRPIIEKNALTYSVASCDVETIDRINILNASIHAMHLALSQLSILPEFILVDGNRFKKYQSITHTCIVDGDRKFLSIAAASILAKTYRDEYMRKLHAEFPSFKWFDNKGYATREHLQAIKEFGITSHHRKTFKPVELAGQLELFIEAEVE